MGGQGDKVGGTFLDTTLRGSRLALTWRGNKDRVRNISKKVIKAGENHSVETYASDKLGINQLRADCY